MEGNQNGRRSRWKITKMEDDQNGRRIKWKTTKTEDNQSGRQPKSKTTKTEGDQNGRRLKGKLIFNYFLHPAITAITPLRDIYGTSLKKNLCKHINVFL